ncbi:MAG: GHKL domain-containing protein [Vicingus serpentipes]|nr:GHKL domain-containing protein [Vicingus serpentipes]
MKNIIRNLWLHLGAGGCLIISLFIQPEFFFTTSFSPLQFNKVLHEKETLASKELHRLITTLDLEKEFNTSSHFNKLAHSGITFYIFENNQPIYWSSRNTSFLNSLTEFEKDKNIVLLKNGWYQYLIKKKNKKTYLALIHIKQQYSIENKYLKNHFHESFNTPSNYTIQLTPSKNASLIKFISGTPLFYLSSNKKNTTSSNTNWIIIAFFFCGIGLIISFINQFFQKLNFIQKYTPLLVSLFISLLWLATFLLKLPKIVFQQELFSPTIYAQSAILPSLGHFLMFAFFFTLLIYQIKKAIKNINPYNKSIASAAIVFIAFFPLIFSNWIEGLVKNSTIIFDTNFLFELTPYSFIALFIIILLCISFLIFIQLILDTFSNKAFKDYHLNTLLIITSIFFIIIGAFFYDTYILLSLWGIAYILTNMGLKSNKNPFYKSIITVIIIALTFSYGFIHFGEEKELLKKEFLAKKLAKEKDPVAEYLFKELKQKIETDTLLKSNISSYWQKKNILDKHLIDKYFGGYWNKYDVNIITACQNQDSLLIEDKGINVNCLSFFKEKVENETEHPFNIDPNINFLYSEEGISSYLAQLKIELPNQKPYFLFIEFFPKVFSKTEGYPELLLNQKEIETIVNLNQYSFAKYKNGKLVNNSGNFIYTLSLYDKSLFNEAGFSSLNFDQHNHLFYQSDKNTVVIVSSPQKTIFNYITTFSYLFLFCFIAVLLFGLTLKTSPFDWHIAYTDFSTKIQLFIISSIFLSFILFGWGTSYYIKKQHLEKNKKNITEKVQSVLIELEHKLGNKNKLTLSDYDEMTYYLIKFSNVFYTDINLYDTTGMLLASSRSEIFNIGLVGEKMEPNAYRELHLNSKSSFIHQENIGGLNYLSAYVPFRNENNKILAYMNLPYFAKQNELENDLSSFYTALLNIYGLLFLISAIIAVFFANYISEPLRMIKDKISALQLGKSYEQIDWESNDEIGSLVLEYNQKVLELERSAQLLIKSERESAWREMAKQVAHEIKNPLTPMKLSIQQLQRVVTDNPNDLNERIDRTAKTLIEQIETLTKIADEFSSFAKMPKADESKIALLPIIETTIDLFNQATTSITLTNKCASPPTIVADKDQLSRVFNNLIKNALQAIPENKKGIINITIQDKNEMVLISIQDNGTGIPEDKKDKIFVPNFTTKTTGMGLGLAIVKNIIEAAQGSIRFETQEDVGTIFFIELPITESN